MLIYEIPSSAAEAVDCMVSRYLRKWLGTPPGLASHALYSRTAEFSLPVFSVLDEYKTAMVRALVSLRV